MLYSMLSNDITQDEYLKRNNITILYKRLPSKRYGFTFTYRDTNIIVLNKLYSYSLKKELLHEFSHIELGHPISNKENLICEYEVNVYLSNLI